MSNIHWAKYKNREVVMFETVDKAKMYVSPKGKSVEFFTEPDHMGKFIFGKEESYTLIKYLIELGQRIKPDFAPKYGNSAGSDCYEYYDRASDNNGYCHATRRLDTTVINFCKPEDGEERLYLMTIPKLADLLWSIHKFERPASNE